MTILALAPKWLKITAAGMLCAFALVSGAFLLGKRDGRSQAEIEAAKAALNRINTLEKNNATFRNLTPRHRCIVFMRDSGLPESQCD